MRKSSTTAKKVKERQITCFDRAAEIASFYGFLGAHKIQVSPADLRKAKLFKDAQKSIFGTILEDKISLTRDIIEKKYSEHPQPLMLYYGGPTAEDKHHMFNMDVSGNPKSIADALIIESCYVIVKEAYPDYELSVMLNTVGDRESASKFTREFQAFLKRNWAYIPNKSKKLVKKNVLEFWNIEVEPGDERFQSIKDQAPTTLSFLSEESRKHFKEVLEYIEVLKIPYTIEHSIIGGRGLSNETVFHIEAATQKGQKTILAFGGRYNGLSKKAWGKKDIPTVFGVIMLPDACKAKDLQKVTVEPQCKVRFFFIQLSFDAKLKSLKVLEILRKAKVPVHQSLSKDKFTGQIAIAEQMDITHLIIMGKKEAMEDSITIRDMNNRVQVTIPIDEIIDYIAKL